MSRRQQRRLLERRHRHMAVAGGGLAVVATLATGNVAEAAGHTYTVSNLNDSGPGSLRQAIADVNADTTDTAAPGDSIVFASGLSGTLAATTSDTSASTFSLSRAAQILGPGANLLAIQPKSGDRILYSTAPVTVSGLTLTKAAAAGDDGPAIDARTSVELDRVAVVGNSGLGYPIDVWPAGSLTINNSTISGNTTSNGASGAYSKYDLTANNSTISGNSGGPAIESNGGTVQVTGSTIADNVPPSADGQVELRNSGTLTLQDSIVSGSSGAHDVALLGSSSGTASFSLIRNTTPPSGGTPIATDTTDKTGVDPQLSQLVSNGGPTPTMAPQPGSPALDAGKAFGLTTDQRGLSRPFALPGLTAPAGGDRSDIGAVEEHTPAISGLLPSSGGAGTHVLIGGTGFTGATKVLFGSTPATSFQVVSDALIVAVAPPHNGPADVRVIGPFGESPIAGADRFTFPTFTPTAKPKHPKGKLKGRTLNTNEKVSCPTGGPSCTFSFSMREHKLKLGKGSVTLAAGQSKKLKLKLSSKLRHRFEPHHKYKLKLTITATDGTGSPITITRTLKLST